MGWGMSHSKDFLVLEASVSESPRREIQNGGRNTELVKWDRKEEIGNFKKLFWLFDYTG